MAFELPKLPYAYDALEPHIDARTMEIHHTKHHQGYTNNLNNAIAGTALEGKSIEELLSGHSDNVAIRNNGGGFYNHNLFWNIMAQNAGGKPTGELAAAIDAAYGSFDAFKAELKSSVQSPKVRFSNSKMVKEIETYKDKYDTMRLRNST